MKVRVFFLFALLISAVSIPAYAAKQVPIGSQMQEIYPDRPFNKVSLYDNLLFIPSYADLNEVQDYLSSHKIKAKVYQSSGLPTLYLQTKSGSETYIHEKKRNSTLGAGMLVSTKGEMLWMGTLDQIRIRGNSSAMYSKKPYQIKLTEKANLLSMGKGRTWVLLANVIDGTMLRNNLALRLAKAADMPFTPDFRTVDLYLNGSYKGVYLLCEKVQIAKNRVSITDLEKMTEAANDKPLEEYGYIYGASAALGTPEAVVTEKGKTRAFDKMPYWNDMKAGDWTARNLPNDPEDITGGYLLEVGAKDNFQTSSKFVCDSGWKMVLKSPEDASQAEVLYIFGVFQNIDRAITDGDWERLTELIDVDSWVKKYVFEELLANFDAGTNSQYFYKDNDSVDGKVYCGPVWDYDNTLGISSLMQKPDVLYLQDTPTAHVHYPFDIFLRITKLPQFMELAKETYKTLFRPLVAELLGEAPSVHLPTITQEAAAISAAREMNYVRWRHYHESRLTPIGDSEAEGLAYLTDYLSKRVAFLDSVWLSD